ncbi:MAG: hypothetical protein K0V04_29085 [Deltaproteobacteria bacterium]|nr:hypothetical protein [Deltaproteobacteria bacterium]
MNRPTLVLGTVLTTMLAVGCAGDDGSAEGSTAAASDGPTTTMSAADSTGTMPTEGEACTSEFPAIVADIDETLTLSDGEFFMQIGDGTYDPAEREGAAEMINAYAALGYRVLYLTARSEMIVLEGTGETARDATARWIDEHGFPNDPATTALVLAESFVVDDAARDYKAQALMDLQAMGWRFDFAYGNATSDIGAYAAAGIALDSTFIIGEHAGVEGTVAVEGEGWVDHTAAHVSGVPQACPGQ